jgi:hypothetical protein
MNDVRGIKASDRLRTSGSLIDSKPPSSSSSWKPCAGELRDEHKVGVSPMQTGFTSSMGAVLLAATSAYGAGPTPEAKKAFMDLKTIYISFDITQAGSADFSAPKDSLTDGAFRVNKSLKFEIPLGMPLPDSCPSGTPMNDAMEQGRCMGWSFNMPDDPGVMDQMLSGKLDLSKNPMFSTARYTVDDTFQSRYRDSPADGFATRTTTYKGNGVTYVNRSGMLLCDFKNMMCDLSGIALGSHLGDQVAITTTDTVPGSDTMKQTQDPALLLPDVPKEITEKLVGWPLTLPGPGTVTFSAPGAVQGGNGKAPVTFKMTVSSRSTASAGAPSK